jgi:pyruvate-ferredoxin/flavodoxin oxidoreductase
MRNNNPTMRGLVEDADVFFPLQEASNTLYAAVPNIVDNLLTKFYEYTGMKFELFQYFGDPEAKYFGSLFFFFINFFFFLFFFFV